MDFEKCKKAIQMMDQVERWPRTVLVTGGCGYIGSALIPYLLRQPEIESVLVVDNLARGRLETIGFLMESHRGRLQFLRADLRWEKEVRSVLQSYEVPGAIIHLAATVDAPGSIDPDRQTLNDEVNRDATRLLAREAADLGVRRFVYLSSTSVYGYGRDDIFDERSVPAPVTPYAKSKLAGERALEDQNGGMSVVVLRPASVIGYAPGYRCEVVAHYLSLYAHFGVPLPIYDGTQAQVRPYVAIEDVVKSVGFALHRSGQLAGEVWNVVTMNATLRELVEALRRVYPALQVRTTEMATPEQISFGVSGEKLRRAGFTTGGNLVRSFEEVQRYFDRVSSANSMWLESELQHAPFA